MIQYCLSSLFLAIVVALQVRQAAVVALSVVVITYTSQTNSGGVSCRHIGNTYQVSGTLSYSITGINPIAYIETSNSLPNIQISYDGNCTSSNASANPTCNITISGTNTESPVSIGVQINGSAGATPFPAGTITIPVCTSN